MGKYNRLLFVTSPDTWFDKTRVSRACYVIMITATR